MHDERIFSKSEYDVWSIPVARLNNCSLHFATYRRTSTTLLQRTSMRDVPDSDSQSNPLSLCCTEAAECVATMTHDSFGTAVSILSQHGFAFAVSQELTQWNVRQRWH